MVDGTPPALDFFAAEHEDVLRDQEVGESLIQPSHFGDAAPLEAESLPFDDDQVEIGIGPSFAPRVGSEEDDPVRIHFVHDRPDHLPENRSGHGRDQSVVLLRHGCRSVRGIGGQHARRPCALVRLPVRPEPDSDLGRPGLGAAAAGGWNTVMGRVAHEGLEHGGTRGSGEAGRGTETVASRRCVDVRRLREANGSNSAAAVGGWSWPTPASRRVCSSRLFARAVRIPVVVAEHRRRAGPGQ